MNARLLSTAFFVVKPGDGVTVAQALLEVAPVLLIGGAALFILFFISARKRLMTDSKAQWPWWVGLGVVGVAVVWATWRLVQAGGRSTRLFGGVLQIDGAARLGMLLTALWGAASLLVGRARISIHHPYVVQTKPYTPGLLLLSLTGMHLALLAVDVLALVLCVELAVLPLVWLVAESQFEGRTTGAFRVYMSALLAAAVFLAGMVCLMIVSDSGAYHTLSARLGGQADRPLVGVAIVLISAGFAWKLAAVPFDLGWPLAAAHSPAPISIMFDVGLKTMVALIGVRLFTQALAHPGVALGPGGWTSLLASIGALTLVVGSTAALMQKRMAQLVAHLAVAQAGWILLAIVSLGLAGEMTRHGKGALGVLLVAQGFGVVGLSALCAWIEGGMAEIRGEGSRFPPVWHKLARRRPLIALAACVLAANLCGLPPSMGFWGRLGVVQILFGMESLRPLGLLAILCWAASALCLLRVVRAIWLKGFKGKEALLAPASLALAQAREKDELPAKETDAAVSAACAAEETDAASHRQPADPQNTRVPVATRVDFTAEPAGAIPSLVLGCTVVVTVVGLWPGPFFELLIELL
jgi:NADH-quinone oxidoreductase subunit N